MLRKKHSAEKGYVFKTPYAIHIIISKMIKLLSDKEEELIMVEYLQHRKSDLYRDILITKQYLAIMDAAPADRKISDVYGELKTLTETVG